MDRRQEPVVVVVRLRSALGSGHLGEKGVERRQKVAEGGEWQDPEPRAFKVSHPPRPALLMNHSYPCHCPCPLPPRRAATWVMGSVCNNTGVAIYSTVLPLLPCSTSSVLYSLLLLNVGSFEPKQSTVELSQPLLQRVLILLFYWVSDEVLEKRTSPTQN